MNFDLFSACVFCAATLFGMDFRPPPGITGEIAAGYSTFQRHDVLQTGDESDVTFKFITAGVRWVPAASAGPGAGTPPTELHVSGVFPSAHAESNEADPIPGRVIATGEGRYENYSVLARVALSPVLSAEGAALIRRHKGTDLVNTGGSKFTFSEQRQTIAEQDAFGLGLRRRWSGLEVGVRWQHSVVQGNYNTASAFLTSRGALDGAGLDVRAARGPWAASLDLQAMTGVPRRHAEAAPDFVGRNDRARAWSQSARLSVSRSFGRWDAIAAVAWDGTRLPFVSLTPLGAETRAFDSGFVADSRVREWRTEIALRFRATRGFLMRIFFRKTESGSESVALTDSIGNRPPRSLDVDRGGNYPFRQYLLGVSEEFGVGAAPSATP